jgi:hypothetical protein
MASFVNICMFNAASSGTGNFVVSSAVNGYQTPASAGAVNGAIYRYRAENADLSQWEVGFGVYTTGSTTLARTQILHNSSGDTSAINFSTAPKVGIVALGQDIGPYDTATVALAADSSQDMFQTRGKLAIGDFGAATYTQQASDPTEDGAFQLTSTRWAKLHQTVVTPQMFKLSTDAGDDGLMLNRFFSYLTSDGSRGVIPRGTYAISTRVDITQPTDRRITVVASGAVFTTSGAIAAFRITGGAYSGGMDLIDFTIDHQANASAINGFEFKACGGCHLINPLVKAGNTSASYAAIYVAQSNTADPNTGSFWNVITNPQLYGASALNPLPCGISLQGAANATRIVGGMISTFTRGIRLDPESASGNYSPNGVVIDGVSFEGGTYGVYYVGVSGDADSRVLGLRVINNRFETVTEGTVFNNCDQVSENPPIIQNNMYLGVTTRVNNPNSINVVGDEEWIPWTTTITATSGTFTSVAANSRYKQQGNIVTFSLKMTITTNGTAAGLIKFTLPLAPASSNVGGAFAGADSTLKAIDAIYAAGTSTDVFVGRYDGVYPGGTGTVIYVSGSYEV